MQLVLAMSISNDRQALSAPESNGLPWVGKYNNLYKKGSENHLKRDWPYSRICWQRFKTCMLYLCLFLVILIFYPFFVSYILFRKLKLTSRSIECIRGTTETTCGKLPPIALFCKILIMGLFFLLLPVLYLMTTVLAIIPGMPFIIFWKSFREFVFTN